MKKHLIILLACTLIMQAPLLAQPHTAADLETALRGARLELKPEAQVVEINESTNLQVMILTGLNFGDQGNATDLPHLEPLPTRSDLWPVPYNATNWRVVSGGGRVMPQSGDFVKCTYVAPPSIPNNVDSSEVVISVDMQPAVAGWPQVTLLVTIYVVSNETAIVVHMPEAGFNDAKYVSNNAGGISIPVVDARAAISPQLQAQMAAVQRQLQNSTVNFNGITSNAKVLYSPKDDKSAIQFTQLALQVNNGQTTLHPEPSATLAVSINGKITKGTYTLDIDPTNLAFATYIGKACTCGHKKDSEGKGELPCRGKVVVESATDTEIKGTISATVYFANNGNKFTGWIYGKFTAMVGTK